MIRSMEVRSYFILIVCLYYMQMIDGNIRHRRHKCTKCPPGWRVLKECSRKTDTVCTPCEAGEGYTTKQSFMSSCWICSKCGIGLFEAHACTTTSDTVCDDCTRFSSKYFPTNNTDYNIKCQYLKYK